MSRKNRSVFLDYVVYAVIRFGTCILQMLSWEAAQGIGAALSWLVYKVDKRHRLVAMENLRKAYPGKYSEEELDQMVREVYRHFCIMLIEIVLIPRKLHLHNHKNHIFMTNPKPMVEGLLSERPLLVVTGHFGNWELAGYALGLCGFKTYAIARVLDNPFLEKWLKKFRQKTGQTILAKKGDFDRINQVLASGGTLATLGDQDAGKRGLFVDFFNRPASTHKAIALMTLQYQVPICVSVARKFAEPLKYEVAFEDLIFPEEFAGRPDALEAITKRYTEALERLIRQAPQQYFWVHNRWKHQPASRKRKAA